MGPFIAKPERKYGDPAADIWTTMFDDYKKSGKGPIYMDCAGISDEDYEYMIHWFEQEGVSSLVKYMKEEATDPRRNPIEFMTYEMKSRGGINYNLRGETSVKGLYAAGDECGGSISRAANFGWIAGENAAKYTSDIKPPDAGNVKAQMEGKKILVTQILSRKVGPNWKEANIALQQIMYDHAGSVRSETMLQAGLDYLRRLKEKAHTTITATNQHELMHCLEVFNLLDLAEATFAAALERKETRGRHIRADYPFTNPLLEKLLIVKIADGNPATEWREV